MLPTFEDIRIKLLLLQETNSLSATTLYTVLTGDTNTANYCYASRNRRLLASLALVYSFLYKRIQFRSVVFCRQCTQSGLFLFVCKVLPRTKAAHECNRHSICCGLWHLLQLHFWHLSVYIRSSYTFGRPANFRRGC